MPKMTLAQALADWFSISETLDRGDACPCCDAEWVPISEDTTARMMAHNLPCIVWDLRVIENHNSWVRKFITEEE